MVNINYGKIIVTGKTYILKFAPYLGDEATSEDYLALGWKKIVQTAPPIYDSNIQNLFSDGYEETDTQLIQKWKVIEKPIPPTIVSKYKLIAKLMEMNIWTQVKQMLENNGLLDLFNAAQELNSDDQFFKRGIQLAKQELGVTDEQIQQILEEVAI